jgi:hypothetical protein
MPDEQLLTSLKVAKPASSLILHVDPTLLKPSKNNKDECGSINAVLAAAIDLVLVRSKVEQSEDGNFDSEDVKGKEITERLANILVKLEKFMRAQRSSQLSRPPPPVGSPLKVSPLIMSPTDRALLLEVALEIGALSNFQHFDNSTFSTITRSIHPAHFRLLGYADILSSVCHDGFSLISNGRKVEGEKGLLGADLASILHGVSDNGNSSINWLTEGDDELLRWIYKDMPNLRDGKEELDDIALLAKHKARLYQALSTSAPSALLDSLSASFHVCEPLNSRGFSLSDVWPNEMRDGEKAKDHFLRLLTPLGDPYA